MDDPLRQPQPCPVCGADDHTCTSGRTADEPVLFAEWSDAPRPPRQRATVTVDRDVYEDISGPNEQRERLRLVARAGQKITRTTARRIGMTDDDIDEHTDDDADDGDDGDASGGEAPRDRQERPPSPRERIDRK